MVGWEDSYRIGGRLVRATEKVATGDPVGGLFEGIGAGLLIGSAVYSAWPSWTTTTTKQTQPWKDIVPPQYDGIPEHPGVGLYKYSVNNFMKPQGLYK